MHRRSRRMLAWWGLVLAVAFSLADRNPVSAGSTDRPLRAEARSDDAEAHQEGARRLAWIVALTNLEISPSVAECLDLGMACSVDAVLELDTARLRADHLAESLTSAIDPNADAYVGDAGPEATALARRTAEAARSLSDLLATWMVSGCAGDISEISAIEHSAPPVAPDDCPRTADEVGLRMAASASTLASWPGP